MFSTVKKKATITCLSKVVPVEMAIAKLPANCTRVLHVTTAVIIAIRGVSRQLKLLYFPLVDFSFFVLFFFFQKRRWKNELERLVKD